MSKVDSTDIIRMTFLKSFANCLIIKHVGWMVHLKFAGARLAALLSVCFKAFLYMFCFFFF